MKVASEAEKNYLHSDFDFQLATVLVTLRSAYMTLRWTGSAAL
jgi:hypothetical protein